MAPREKCVRDYEQCLDSFARQVTNNLVTSAVKTMRSYCTNSGRRATFIKLAECENPRKSEQDQLMVAFIDAVRAINTVPDKNMKIPLFCWSGLNSLTY